MYWEPQAQNMYNAIHLLFTIEQFQENSESFSDLVLVQVKIRNIFKATTRYRR